MNRVRRMIGARRSTQLNTFVISLLFLMVTPFVVRAGDDNVRAYASVSAVVKPGEGGSATGHLHTSGETFRGDVLDVLQKLSDRLGLERRGPGGKIVVRNGRYRTANTEALQLRNSVHIVSESRHGAVIALAPEEGKRRNDHVFFRGRDVRDVVVDGIEFQANREETVITTPLTRDAEAGDKRLYVEEAKGFANRGRSIGKGRPKRGKPGGFRVSDKDGSERAMASDVDVENGIIHLKFDGLRNDFSVNREAKAVYYPMIGGIDIEGSDYAVRNCRFVDMQENCGVRARGGKKPGPKVLENNQVIDLRGGTGIRLHRIKRGGIMRGNYVRGCRAGYNKFWGEGISIEQNRYTTCTGNIVVGPGDRLLRANYAHNSTISNNVIRVPLTELSLGQDAGWKPLRGDETLEFEQGGIRVNAGESGQPGIHLPDLPEEHSVWTGDGPWERAYNRVHVDLSCSVNAADVRLRTVDGEGNYKEYRARTWVAGEREVLSFPLEMGSGGRQYTVDSHGDFDGTDVQEVKLYCAERGENVAFRVYGIRLGMRSGWGITIWKARNTTVSNNVLHGVGSNRGSIYYWKNAGRDLTITGNTLTYCYEGIGGHGTGRITVANNVLHGTMSGIRGEVTASGNVLSFVPNAMQVNGAQSNLLYKSQPISMRPEAGVFSGNVMIDYRGRGLLSRFGGGVVSNNLFRTSTQGTAIYQDDGGDSLISGNWISGGTRALHTGGSGSVMEGNFVRKVRGQPIRDTGSTNDVSNNYGVMQKTVKETLSSSDPIAARLTGVSSNHKRTPQVRRIELTGDPAGSDWAVNTEPTWNAAENQWDIAVEWRTRPDEDLKARFVIER